MYLTIKTITKTDHPAWDDYVLNHPECTLFHLIRWKAVIEKTFGHKTYYLLATNQSQTISLKSYIVGVLPLFQMKSLLFGNYLVSIPFAEIGGALAEDPSVEAALIKHATQIAETIKCDYLELRNRTAVQGLKTKELYFNFKREILPELNDNLMAIPRKARRMIRQGEKNGLTAHFGCHQMDDFYQIMCSSYRNLGTPIFSKRFFQNLIDGFGEQCQILMIRTKQGRPAAGVLSFFFRDQVLPYYAGSEVETRHLATNDFMYWQLLKYGWQQGYKIFDYGRSKVNTGSFDFKRHWGFDPQPLAYQYKLVRARELPNLSPTNPKYKKKIEAWRRLPLSITRILGPPIAKYLA